MMNIVSDKKAPADLYQYLMEKDREDDLEIGETRTNVVRGRASALLRSIEDGKVLKDRKISQADFDKLKEGLDPTTSVPLSRFERIKFEQGKEFKHRRGWDINFAPDKSVSVVWALADDDLRNKISAAHAASIDRTMQYIESNLAFTRVGPNKDDLRPLSGLVWTRFDHLTSRELDPQLHSHNWLFNVGLRSDGTFGALETKPIFENQHLLDGVYQAEFASRLEKLGLALDHNDYGGFKIQGVPKSVTERFSKRQLQVKEAIEKFGYRTPGGFADAAKLSRATKKHVAISTLNKAWQEQGVSLGFTQKDVLGLVRNQQGQFKARSISKEISGGLNRSGAEHSFGPIINRAANLKTLADFKSPASANGGIANAIARDVGKSSQLIQKGAKTLVTAALPMPAAALLSKAKKLARTAKKARGAQRRVQRDVATPQRQRSQDQDRDQ